MKNVKLFLKIFFLVFAIDMFIGFSMAYIVGNNAPGIFAHIIDEVISFPLSLWNRIFPEYGIYRADITSKSMFWTIILFNALCQAVLIFGLIKLLKTKSSSK